MILQHTIITSRSVSLLKISYTNPPTHFRSQYCYTQYNEWMSSLCKNTIKLFSGFQHIISLHINVTRTPKTVPASWHFLSQDNSLVWACIWKFRPQISIQLSSLQEGIALLVFPRTFWSTCSRVQSNIRHWD